MQEANRASPSKNHLLSSMRGPGAIVVGMVLILLVTVALLLTFSRSNDEPANTSAGDGAGTTILSDEEAVARFLELHDMSVDAIRNRDPSLIRFVARSNSPAGERLSEAIRGLSRDRVVDASRIRTEAVEVVQLRATEIQILHTESLYPCFKTESGRDVTQGPSGIKQDVLWTLRLQGAEWLLYDSVVQQDRRIPGKRNAC